MPYEILTIPCLSDNYAFLIGNTVSSEAALIDAPEAAPINAALKAKGWTLKRVLLTHHHWDHVDALHGLDRAPDCKLIGARADAHRLPDLDIAVDEGDEIVVCGLKTRVIDVSGHTLGHIAYHMPEISAVFTADSLMALGCGRLFEGTPEQMLSSLEKLAALPKDTVVYSGHEYTHTNARFALTIEPDNSALISRANATTTAREAGEPTVPSSLELELATNPFLRAHVPQIAKHLGMAGASKLEVFTEIRERRNGF